MQEVEWELRGLQPVALAQVEERATERERRLHLVKEPPEGVGVVRFQAKEVALGDLLVEANQAWAGTHPASWISSLCADPQDSPRPKG